MYRSRETRFAAMGSVAHVLVVDGPVDLLEAARSRLAELESRWSRFLPDSDVSRHNAAILAGDEPPPCSVDTHLLFDRAASGFRITGGRFDPYRLDAVTASGYTRSLTGHDIDGRVLAPLAGFDPGGIGKGLAADVVSAELIAAGAAGAMVSVGGDLRVRGLGPEGAPWRIDIEDPRDGGVLTTVELDDGAIATSSQLKRRWTTASGEPAHHLIDPRTDAPSRSPVLAATVIAAEAWQAEVLTKVAFLDAIAPAGIGSADTAVDEDAGLRLVESLHAAALVVTPGVIATTSQWHRFEPTKAGTS